MGRKIKKETRRRKKVAYTEALAISVEKAKKEYQ
jgi:hypothetical protein